MNSLPPPLFNLQFEFANITLVVGLTFGSLFLIVFTWATARKIKLLNRTLQTNMASTLITVGQLFLLLSIVTLILVAQLWINLLT